MSSPLHQPQTILFPVSLPASGFDRALFPVSTYKKRDSLGRSEYYLDATLDELLKIPNIVNGANHEQWQVFFDATKARYDQLMQSKAKLDERPKTWNLLKMFAKYRAVRLFFASSKSLYNQTKSRSDEMRRTVNRALLSVPSADVQPVEDDSSPDENLAGIAVKIDGPLDENIGQQIMDAANTIASYSGPFESDEAASEVSSVLSQEYYLASQSLKSDAEEETPDVPTSPNPSSPLSITHKNYYACIFLEGSTIDQVGGTTQFGGRGNSGSVNHNFKTTSDMLNPLV